MAERFLHLHGFASGPGSQKAAFFRRKFLARGVELRIPDLSDGDFEGLTLTRQLAVIDREAAGGVCIAHRLQPGRLSRGALRSAPCGLLHEGTQIQG